jgi:hypothetical protein
MEMKKLNIAAIVAIVAIAALCAGFFYWPWGPPEFLGEDDFEGHSVPPVGPVVAGGLQGTYIGTMTFTNIDRSTVANLLPPGFELAPRATTNKPDLHPIVLLFGDPTDGAFVLSATSIQPTGIHYSEMILAIPFVQKTGQTGAWHTYIVRMYLDHQAAVTGGIPYAYKKVLASIEWTGRYARVWESPGGDLLEGDFRWGAKWYDGNAALLSVPNFQDMVNIMSTEILGHNGIIPICSQFEWNFDRARVAKAYSTYTMKQPFRVDMGSWPALSPFKNVNNGAVVMRGLRWRLASQIACRF